MRALYRHVTAALSLALLLTASSSAMAYEVMTVPQFGCDSVRWPARLLPAPYFVNESGYTGLPMSTVTGRIADAFAVWGEPCCSSFAATYKGTTSDDTYTDRNVIHFYENGWPSTLGDVSATIGAAVPLMTSNCEIVQADIAFNATAFTFVDGAPAPNTNRNADLMSIAVHEGGHFLGLDHTAVTTASMVPRYSNGIDERDLDQDDEDGVCFLYPAGCPCVDDSDCQAPEVCLGNGTCGVLECSANQPCPRGEWCDEGVCMPEPDSDVGGGDTVVVNDEDGGCCAISLRTSRRDAPVGLLALASLLGVAWVRRRSNRAPR